MSVVDQPEPLTALEASIGAALDALKARDSTKDAGEKAALKAQYEKHLGAIRALVDQQADDQLGETWWLLIWSTKRRPRKLATDLGRHQSMTPKYYRKGQIMGLS